MDLYQIQKIVEQQQRELDYLKKSGILDTIVTNLREAEKSARQIGLAKEIENYRSFLNEHKEFLTTTTGLTTNASS